MQTKNFLPRPVPLVLKLILGLSLLGSLFSKYLIPYLSIGMPASGHFQFWQFFTYPFIHQFPSELLSLLFDLYMLWIFGVSLIQRTGQKLFTMLFFFSTLAGGLAALGTMALTHHPLFFFSATPVIYAILTSWVMLNKETHLLLFFTLPIKAANLLLLLIGFSLALDLSSSNFTGFFASLAAVLYSYLFTLLACRAKSPFSFLDGFERTLLKLLEKGEHIKDKKTFTKAKIFDFKSGKAILSDEEFMDAILQRISLYGESTISPEERVRMAEISSRKRK